MPTRPEFALGDIVRMKKKHPCGGYLWKVTRIGADIKMKCVTCERVVMLPRAEFERRMVRVEEHTSAEKGTSS